MFLLLVEVLKVFRISPLEAMAKEDITWFLLVRSFKGGSSTKA